MYISNTVQDLKGFLNNLGIKFILAGSEALVAHGINIHRRSHDIDIMISDEITTEQRDKLKTLQDAAGVTAAYSNNDMYSFNFEGTVVDCFIINDSIFDLEYKYALEYDGVKIRDIMDIINWKKQIGRNKDINDIYNIIQCIVSKEK